MTVWPDTFPQPSYKPPPKQTYNAPPPSKAPAPAYKPQPPKPSYNAPEEAPHIIYAGHPPIHIYQQPPVLDQVHYTSKAPVYKPPAPTKPVYRYIAIQFCKANNPSCLETLIPLSYRPTTAKPVYESLPQAAPQYQAPPKKTYKAPSKPTYTKPSYKAPQPKPQSYRWEISGTKSVSPKLSKWDMTSFTFIFFSPPPPSKPSYKPTSAAPSYKPQKPIGPKPRPQTYRYWAIEWTVSNRFLQYYFAIDSFF